MTSFSESEKKSVGKADKLNGAKEKLNSITAEKKKEIYGKIKKISIQATGGNDVSPL